MKKIILFFLSAVSLTAVSQTYIAGTIYPGYYDIDPDTLIHYSFPYSNAEYNINMFGDAANDIVLTAHGAASSGGSDSYIRVESLNPNVFISFGRLDSVLCPISLNWIVTKIAKPLSAGDAINTGTTMWEDSILYLSDHSAHSGCNKDVNDWLGGERYLGIKYQNGSTVSYGWIMVNCVTVDSCYIMEFSYSSVVSDVAEKFNSRDISIYPNPSSGIFDVRMKNNSATTKISVYDVLGNRIWNKDACVGASVSVDLSGQSKGIYFMEVVSGEAKSVRKIILD